MRHIRGLMAITCGSPNSYRRILPHYWSSAYEAYGFDNREGAIRIPSPFWGREAESINLEIKFADHSGNPYLSMGALMAAGLDGIKNSIDPGEPEEIDPGNYSDEERERRGIRRLPTSLDEALDELERDQVLLDALGPWLLPGVFLQHRTFPLQMASDPLVGHLPIPLALNLAIYPMASDERLLEHIRNAIEVDK